MSTCRQLQIDFCPICNDPKAFFRAGVCLSCETPKAPASAIRPPLLGQYTIQQVQLARKRAGAKSRARGRR